MPEIDVTPFSPIMRRLLRAIGIEAAGRLLRWRGGRRLCVPRDPEHTDLLEYLAPAQIEALIGAFGPGMWVSLPKIDQLHIVARNRQIRAEHQAGASLATLAARYGLTTRHIANIVGDQDGGCDRGADDTQPTLFP